ncbi:MAG: GyrI-like domain-containing protein [Mariprofundaceae bacterium]|nr:GyrI-like domain-containing protein [Mariprofundaceae bacterium]
MSQAPRKSLPKPILKMAGFGLIMSLVGTIVVIIVMGSFSKPELELKVTPDYTFAYIDHVGPYNKVDGLIDTLREELKNSNLTMVDAAVLYLDDASEVKLENQRSKVGFIVARNAVIPGKFESMIIKSQEALVATFHGGSMMGSYKSYAAMQEWAALRNKKLSLPALEIYHGKSSIEYHMALVAKK